MKAICLFDLHIPYNDKELTDKTLKLIKANNFDEIILGGDAIDCNQLSKFVCYESKQLQLNEELKLLKDFIIELKKISDAKIIYLGCNHFVDRLNRILYENSITEFVNIKDYVEKELGVDEYVDYNVPYFPFNQNKVACIHGFKHSKYFTAQYTQLYTYDIVCGHTHTFQRYSSENGVNGYGVGCMCEDMAYMRNKPVRWRKGVCIINYNKYLDEHFIEMLEYKKGTLFYKGDYY